MGLEHSYLRAGVDAMSGYTPGEQPRDRDIIKLNTNENPYPPSPQVLAALREYSGERLNRYPDPVCTELQSVAASLFDVPADWVVLGNGSDDILTMIFRAVADQGDQVAWFEPSYSLYPVLGDIQGAKHLPIPLNPDFTLPAYPKEQLASARLLLITSPNAPSGRYYSPAQLAEWCERFPGVVVIDEAYADFAEDNGMALTRQFANVIVSRSLSKSYSLAGIRLGAAVAQPHLAAGLLKVKDSYNVNGLTQTLGVAALRDQAHMRDTVQRICNTRERVRATLAELGFELCPTATNFLFAKPPMPATDFVAALRRLQILVRHFASPGVCDFVRVTIGTDAEMDRFLSATRTIVGASPTAP